MRAQQSEGYPDEWPSPHRITGAEGCHRPGAAIAATLEPQRSPTRLWHSRTFLAGLEGTGVPGFAAVERELAGTSEGAGPGRLVLQVL